MHQHQPRLTGNVRRKIVAALVVASGAGLAAAEEPAEPPQPTERHSTLELRLTRRPWLETASKPETETPQADSPQATQDAPESPALDAATMPQASTSEPDHGTAPSKQGKTPSLRKSAGQFDEFELSPVPASLAEPDSTRSSTPETEPMGEPLRSTPDGQRPLSVDDGWVARDAVNQVQPLRDPHRRRPEEASAERKQAKEQPEPVLGHAESTRRSQSTRESSADEWTLADPVQPVDSSEEFEEIVVRSLRVGRDGSLPGNRSTDQVEKSPAGDRGKERLSEPTATDTTSPQESSEETISGLEELDYTGRPIQSFDVKPAVKQLQPAMRRCLQYYFDRPERATRRSNWGMLHSIMVYGVDTPILAGQQSYSAIAWIAGNNACRGKRLLQQGSAGIEADTGIGLQGHQAQMLAVFALVGVPADYPLYAGPNKYSVKDLVRTEVRNCRSGEELTFSLIGLSHYLDTDEQWIGGDGQQWDFERLIREELSQPIVGTACGGTHRLMGFAHALRQRRHEGRPITGQWRRAEKFLEDFVAYTYQLQNRDGSMSTDWFESRENNGDLDRKVQTTGHMVEWLLTVTPDSELQNPKLVRSIRFLLKAMYNERGHDWSIGPKGHALRSLSLYYQRVYDEGAPWDTPSVATSNRTRRR